jgi:hypothetical protein
MSASRAGTSEVCDRPFLGGGSQMSIHNDERITIVRQRWAARGMTVLSIALSIDLFIRAVFIKQDPRQFIDIAIIWIVTSFFVCIGMSASGIAPFEGRRRKIWISVGILAIEIPLILILLGMVHSLTDFITDAICAAVGAFVTFIFMQSIYSLWEHRTLGRG